MSRDPYGVRPLFFGVDTETTEDNYKTKGLFFSSEVKGIHKLVKYIEPFISIVHSFDGSSSGFDSFCVANFEMAMTIADLYPNFYKKKSVSISRSHSSGSLFGHEEMSKADNVGAGIESIKSATSVLENQDDAVGFDRTVRSSIFVPASRVIAAIESNRGLIQNQTIGN